MERNFKGIWIPKEIWEEDNLSILEKVMLVEIDSLEDEDKGCYASNKYFSNFFKLSNSRVSQIINDLKEKKYITIEYKYNGKEIVERVIRVNKPPFPEVFNKLNRYLENYKGGIKYIKQGIKYSKGGYLENAKDNNISINNISNKINKDIYIQDFENLWSMYPKKQGKTNAYKDYLKAIKSGVTNEEILNGLNNYLEYIRIEKIKPQYIKNGSTWFHQNCWNDDYSIQRELTTKDLADKMDFSEFR